MAKTKTPFFGLAAHGTVGGSITAQSLPKDTLLRSKPLPTYRYTLPQAYQRWLYEDYAYLWRQQTSAVQAQYRTAGVPYHLTAFQYWMKYNLTNLPDIDICWHFDLPDPSIAHDYSKNALHGTVIGASPATGPIANQLHFDGINDYVHRPVAPPLAFSGEMTLELFYTPIKLNARQRIIDCDSPGDPRYQMTYTEFNQFQFHVNDAVGGSWLAVSPPGQTAPTPYHLCFLISTNYQACYSNAQLITQGAVSLQPFTPLSHLKAGAYWWPATQFANAYIDNIIKYNRLLDLPTILRQSLRRYPP